MVKRSRQDKDNEKIPLRPHHNGTEGVKKKVNCVLGLHQSAPYAIRI